MTEEKKNLQAQIRTYPSNEQEMWTTREALFPIVALNEEYEKFKRSGKDQTAHNLFIHLLHCVKP